MLYYGERVEIIATRVVFRLSDDISLLRSYHTARCTHRQ